jgi:hypothetical protein
MCVSLCCEVQAADILLSESPDGQKARIALLSDCFIVDESGVRVIIDSRLGAPGQEKAASLSGFLAEVAGKFRAGERNFSSPWLILLSQEYWTSVGLPSIDHLTFKDSGECWIPAMQKFAWGSCDSVLKGINWKGLSEKSNRDLRKAFDFDAFRAYFLIESGILESPAALFDISLWNGAIAFTERLIMQKYSKHRIPSWIVRIWALCILLQTMEKGAHIDFNGISEGSLSLRRVLAQFPLKPYLLDFEVLTESDSWSELQMAGFEGKFLLEMEKAKIVSDSILEILEKLYDREEMKEIPARISTRGFLQLFKEKGLNLISGVR